MFTLVPLVLKSQEEDAKTFQGLLHTVRVRHSEEPQAQEALVFCKGAAQKTAHCLEAL